jgi:Uma2 family endonuclease
MKVKIEEYLSIGVEWIWLVDPDDKTAICYSQANPAGSVCEVLRTENPLIEIPLEKALAG